MSTSLPSPPNRLAAGSAPLTSLSVIVSLPPSPNTWMRAVLATVGVPPATATAPPLTRIWPAALRLTVIELSRLSPLTDRVPALNDAVVAALAGELATASRPAVSAVPASSRRVRLAFIGGLLRIGVTGPKTPESAGLFPAQYERGRPSTFVATKLVTRLLETGATL